MGLDKGILYGKEHREQYRLSKRTTASCRNHGGCPWCERNRTIQSIRMDLAARQRLKEDLDQFFDKASEMP